MRRKQVSILELLKSFQTTYKIPENLTFGSCKLVQASSSTPLYKGDLYPRPMMILVDSLGFIMYGYISSILLKPSELPIHLPGSNTLYDGTKALRIQKEFQKGMRRARFAWVCAWKREPLSIFRNKLFLCKGVSMGVCPHSADHLRYNYYCWVSLFPRDLKNRWLELMWILCYIPMTHLRAQV